MQSKHGKLFVLIFLSSSAMVILFPSDGRAQRKGSGGDESGGP